MERKKEFIIKLTVAILALGGWMEFLLKPSNKFLQEGGTIGQILSESTKFSSELYPVYGTGYLFLISIALISLTISIIIIQIFRSFLRYLDKSEVGISVVYTKISVRICDIDPSKSTVTRTQIFHANKKGISAYHLQYGPSSEQGIMVNNSTKISSTINRENINKNIITDKSGKSLKVIETYKRDLPTNFLATYLPDNIVLYLYRHKLYFHKILVLRTLSVEYKDEFSNSNSHVAVTAPRYPASSVNIEIDFPKEFAPNINDFNCFRIADNSVKSINVVAAEELNSSRIIYSAEAERLFKETIRLSW